MLKFKINKSVFEKLSDNEKSLYKLDGEDYQLQIDGVVEKSKVDEFRNKNIDLIKKYDGIDVEKYKELLEKEKVEGEKKLKDSGDFEKLFDERLKTVTSDYEAKIKTLGDSLNEKTNLYQSTVSKYEIEGATNKAFASSKINPDAYSALMGQVKSKFSVVDGKVIAKDGDKILTGSNGNLTISEFIESQPSIFKLQSNGGGGLGNSGTAQTSEKTSSELIASGLKNL